MLFACSVGTAALAAMILTTLATSSLKRQVRRALLLARDLGGHLHVHRNAPPDNLSEIEALLRGMVEERKSDRAQGMVRAQDELRDVHVAISDVVKGDRDKARLLEYADELVEKERERISLEIHDNLNATVVSIKLYAETIATSAGALPPEDVRHYAAQIVIIASEFYDSARAIVRQLRPEVLDTLGLNRAIAELVRTLNEGKGNCRFECHDDSSLEELPGALSIAVYRVVQEALANVVKHSGATLTSVRITGAPPPHQVRIVVCDNGIGIDAARQQSPGRGTAGLGLIGMRERVHRLGGSFGVASGAQGTCITMVM
jgi:two-component system sensor histidine kinase UhpB